MKINKNKIAVVMLAYADFEAMEIALAAYSKFMKEGVNFYILQNGRGTYDCERTYRLAKRYEQLFPKNIKVIDWITPKLPYFSIKELLNSDEFKQYDYVCKVDDDVYPINEFWLEKLIECYEKSYEKYGEKLGYVTSLVNNNPWGFNETLEIFNLKNEYFEKIAIDHYVGDKDDKVEPLQIVPKEQINTGWGGTVWANPFISRWLHKKTTFYPEKFLELTQNLGYKEVDNQKRYSINCMFFKKEFWNLVDNNSDCDEYLILDYCRKNDLKIISDLSNPFIHLCFWIQREENRDLLPQIREVYEKFLDLPYPIAVCPNKDYENENRLRFIEAKLSFYEKKEIEYSLIQRIFSVKNYMNHKVFTVLGIKIKVKK